MSTSNIKTNLKFVMGNTRASKQNTKNIGTINSEFQSTINVSTNNKIKEKSMSKGIIDPGKSKENTMLSGQTNNSQSTSNINSKSNSAVNSRVNHTINLNDVPPLNTSNFIKKNISNEKQFERDVFPKTPVEINLKSFLRDNSKENNYINSNNSTEGNISKNKFVKIKRKHQKHTSEIPQSFKNSSQIADGNNYSSTNNFNKNNFDKTFDQSSKSNLFDIYSKHQVQAFPKNINCIKLRDEISLENDKTISKNRSHNLLMPQMEGSMPPVNRKVTAPNTDVEITDEVPNRISQGPTQPSTNVTFNNTCFNCKDLKYNVLLSNYKQQEKNQKEILATMEILKSYIKFNNSLTDKKKLEISENLDKKSFENRRLREENASIKKQNLELKLTLLRVFNEIKNFENNMSIRDMEMNSLFSQILVENEFLRYSNENFIGASLDKKNNLKEFKNIETDREIFHNADYNENLINEKPRQLHKRQKTHFNFQNLQNLVTDDNTFDQTNTSEMNTESDLKSVNSVNSILHSENLNNENKGEGDLFDNAFKEINLHNTIRKIAEQQQLNNSTNNNLLTTSTSSNSSQKNQKPVYLFYRTPSSKENKKIEFLK